MEEMLVNILIGVASSIIAALILIYAIEIYKSRVTFGTVMKNVVKLHKLIVGDGFVPDLIVAIDRNSSVVGAMLSGYFGLKAIISIATINTREPDGSRKINISPDHLPQAEVISKRKLLILICCNDSGTSLATVYDYFASIIEAPGEIRTAALYTTISPRLKPQYFSVEVGEDIKVPMNKIISRMPWMYPGWNHVFGKERKIR